MTITISFYIPADNGGYYVRYIEINNAHWAHGCDKYIDIRVSKISHWIVFSSNVLPANPDSGTLYDVADFDNIEFRKSQLPGCQTIRIKDFSHFDIH